MHAESRNRGISAQSENCRNWESDVKNSFFKENSSLTIVCCGIIAAGSDQRSVGVRRFVAPRVLAKALKDTTEIRSFIA